MDHVVKTGPERGYNASDLDEIRKDQLRDRLTEVRPDLYEKGVEVLRQKKAATEAFEALRVELHKTLGGDGVLDALRMLEDMAALTPKKPAAQPGDGGVFIHGGTVDAMKATHQPKVVSGRRQ